MDHGYGLIYTNEIHSCIGLPKNLVSVVQRTVKTESIDARAPQSTDKGQVLHQRKRKDLLSDEVCEKEEIHMLS